MTMVLGALWVVLWGVVFLSVLVFIHEGGRYLAARAFDVRVTEFYLGLPCPVRIFHKSKKHGTEFGVTAFLLGGYNRISGMGPIPEGDLARAFAIVQREGRIDATDVATEMGISDDEAYSLLIGLCDLAAIRPFYNPELGEEPTQKTYPAAFETIARDGNFLTEYDSGHDFDAPGTTGDGVPRPLTHPERQLEDERSHTYQGLGYFKRLAILVAGPLVNIILALLLVTAAYMSYDYVIAQNVNVLGTVEEGSIAEAAGLKEGDTIVSVAGTETADWMEVVEALGSAKEAGNDFEVVYERDGQRQATTVDLPEGETVDIIGVMPTYEPYHMTLGESVSASFNYAGLVASVAVRLIMPQHTMEVLDQSSSVVGISVMAAEAVSAGFWEAMAVIAAISMSLGFMNLLPIPPLDGGKILMETVSLIIRRPVPTKVTNGLSYAGVAFFIFIFCVALKNDILGIVSGL